MDLEEFAVMTDGQLKEFVKSCKMSAPAKAPRSELFSPTHTQVLVNLSDNNNDAQKADGEVSNLSKAIAELTLLIKDLRSEMAQIRENSSSEIQALKDELHGVRSSFNNVWSRGPSLNMLDHHEQGVDEQATCNASTSTCTGDAGSRPAPPPRTYSNAVSTNPDPGPCPFQLTCTRVVSYFHRRPTPTDQLTNCFRVRGSGVSPFTPAI